MREKYTIEQHKEHERLVSLGSAIVQNAHTLYIDLDVESDGKPGYGSLLSIGAVTPHGDEFYRELKPESNLYVPRQRQFCEDHGLQRVRLEKEGIAAGEAMTELDAWVRKHATVDSLQRPVALSAFNASFDFPWIDLEMTKAGIKNPFGSAGYCLKSLAMNFGLIERGEYEWDATKKSKLPPELTPEREFTHHALEDAKWQQEFHFALVGLILARRAA